MIYFLIFISKVIENGLSTLRLIVVSNGKKILGSILQFIIALVWIMVTGIVVVDIKNDPLKILFFALGSLVGSYLGSVIEEKIDDSLILINLITCNKKLNKYLNELNYKTTILKSNTKDIILLVIKRKNKKDFINLIKSFDSNIIIYSEKIRNFN